MPVVRCKGCSKTLWAMLEKKDYSYEQNYTKVFFFDIENYGFYCDKCGERKFKNHPLKLSKIWKCVVCGKIMQTTYEGKTFHKDHLCILFHCLSYA